MRFFIHCLAIALGLASAGAASAQDKMLDLSKPSNVASALMAAGYKAVLKQNSRNEPYILSSSNGTDFTIEFYGCKGQSDCGSYQFTSWYKPDPLFTVAFANEWNVAKRFLKVAIDKDGNLNEYMDFTAVGTISQQNFADIVDWYKVMDAELAKFIDGKRPAK
ncbi:YbjN domain-containing protein [Sphingomonas sp. 28-63-12]|uniref:YbjN domain-containing protein n=1 Tax=Sphingomonas sp. 28-63-12 TaxID=1970434 RepID=UPI0035A877F1